MASLFFSSSHCSSSLFIVSLLILLVTGQPDEQDPVLHPNFNIQRYLGTWYEIYRPNDQLFKVGTDRHSVWSQSPNGTIGVAIRQWIPSDNRWEEQRGYARIQDPANEPARMALVFPNTPDADYRVLFTNYTNSTAIYSANDYLNYGLVLSRTTTPSDSSMNQIFRALNNRVGLGRDFFELSPQGVAPYDFDDAPRPPPAPTEEPSNGGGDVLLQENFNAAAYTGRWYEIYRHKAIPYESGTDVTATYTQSIDGTVLVTNREWLPDKNRWNVANAIAKVTAPARLTVFFNNNTGQPGDYRVVYTDYSNVAAVYSEASRGQYKAQYAWILARNPVSGTQSDAVNRAMSTLERRTGIVRDDLVEVEHGTAVDAAVAADSDTKVAKPSGNVSASAKCKYQVASTTCMRYIGRYTVFDRVTGACGFQATACNALSVSRYAFNSIDECIYTCNAKQ